MESPPPRARGFFSSGDGIAIAGTGIAIALAIGQCTSANKASELQTKQNHVKMAVGILSQRPPTNKEGRPQEFSEGEQELRRWSIRLLNENAGEKEKIPPAAEDALITGAANLSKWYESGSFYSGWYSDDYDYESDEAFEKVDGKWYRRIEKGGVYGYQDISPDAATAIEKAATTPLPSPPQRQTTPPHSDPKPDQ